MTGQSGDTRGEVIYAVINHEAICHTSAPGGWVQALKRDAQHKKVVDGVVIFATLLLLAGHRH